MGAYLKSLIWTPWWALLATLATLPLLAVGGAVIGFLGYGIVSRSAQGVVVPSELSGLGLGIILAAILFYLLISVQMPRYAASLSGAQKLSQQPPFGQAFLKGLVVFVLFNIVLIILVVLIVIGLLSMAGDGVRAEIEQLAALEDGAALPTDLMLIFRAIGVVLTMMFAIALVSRVTGMVSALPEVLGIGAILYRLLIAAPVIMLLSMLAGLAVVSMVNSYVPLPRGPAQQLLSLLEQFVMVPLIYAHEALLLGVGMRRKVPAVPQDAPLEEKPDYAAIRASWNS
ncbi:MAG: hypothetical protein AAGK00_18000 [Pseudomonadota bacterium]